MQFGKQPAYNNLEYPVSPGLWRNYWFILPHISTGKTGYSHRPSLFWIWQQSACGTWVAVQIGYILSQANRIQGNLQHNSLYSKFQDPWSLADEPSEEQPPHLVWRVAYLRIPWSWRSQIKKKVREGSQYRTSILYESFKSWKKPGKEDILPDWGL